MAHFVSDTSFTSVEYCGICLRQAALYVYAVYQQDIFIGFKPTESTGQGLQPVQDGPKHIVYRQAEVYICVVHKQVHVQLNQQQFFTVESTGSDR